MRHLTVIGAGTIGTAIAQAVVDGGLIRNDSILFIERSSVRRDEVQKMFPQAEVEETCPQSFADTVLLATKPQDAQHLFAEIRGRFTDGACVISMMAGVTLAEIEHGLDHANVVRVMTNTPITVQQAFSVWIASPEMRDEDKRAVREMLSVFGYEEEVRDEGLLDVATAVSGSGPAYMFTFFEALIEAGEALGLSRIQAEQWVRRTALGAVTLWEEENEQLASMTARVKSKGGTTEAALKDLPVRELKKMWKEAVLRAHKRSKELSHHS